MIPEWPKELFLFCADLVQDFTSVLNRPEAVFTALRCDAKTTTACKV
jgi:hypothetical protein